MVALDIKGAFDRVWHHGLFQKLTLFGITVQLLTWMKIYLSHRHLEVVVAGQKSACYEINAVVPQGSILGPTLFLIYIEDLHDVIRHSELLAYADDTTIFTSIKNSPPETRSSMRVAAANQLQEDLEQINIWGQTWKVEFEPTKSQCLTVSNMKDIQNHPPIMFQGQVVSDKPEMKLLGVTFSRKLEWKTHLKNITRTAGQRTSMLRRLGPVFDKAGLVTIYKTYIRSKMEYAPLAWMGASTVHLSALDKIQRRACRLIGLGPEEQLRHNLSSLSHRRNVAAASC